MWTRHQAAVIAAYTGVLCGPFDEFHRYVEKILGRPVWTHEFADDKVVAQIKEASKDDFMKLVRR